MAGERLQLADHFLDPKAQLEVLGWGGRRLRGGLRVLDCTWQHNGRNLRQPKMRMGEVA